MSKLWILPTVFLAACGCPPTAHDCTPDNQVTFHGEAFPLRAFGNAGDHFIARIDHDIYTTHTTQHELAELDRSGQLLSITEVPRLAGDDILAVAGDGNGNALVVAESATWLRSGTVIEEIAIDGDAAAAFAEGTYVLAIASTPRKLLRYDTNGNVLETVVVPDEGTVPGIPSAPSLAIDPLGTGIAVGWTMKYGNKQSYVVNWAGVMARDIELGNVIETGGAGWTTTVAMRAGTIAILFGQTGKPMQLARVAMDGTIATTPIALAHTCTELVATVAGYVATCQKPNAPAELLFLDENGTIVRTADGAATRLASTRGAALAVTNGANFSLSTLVLDGTQASPTLIFEGRTEASD